jgi:peptidoglycan/xylan/chitin deacetylase (PgdA/CDA1 family)
VRLDRFITLNFVRPLRRALRPFPSSAPRPLKPRWAVPILMYHSISDEPEPGVAPYYRLNTSPTVFREHLQFLADRGYRSLSLDELSKLLLEANQGNSCLSPGCLVADQPLVVLTFDDGFRNFFTEAFPALQEHGFTATVFLATSFIGDSRRHFAPRSTLPPPRSTSTECLTWSEVRELRRAGIEFGSHSVNHPKLVELGGAEIKSEISDSKSEIEQQLGAPITAFCFPYAFPQADHAFARELSELLGETGYTCCTTTELGRVQPGDDCYRLKRLPANSLDDLPLFAAKLEGSYDWLARPQAMVKRLKPRSCRQPSALDSRPSTTFARP